MSSVFSWKGQLFGASQKPGRVFLTDTVTRCRLKRVLYLGFRDQGLSWGRLGRVSCRGAPGPRGAWSSRRGTKRPHCNSYCSLRASWLYSLLPSFKKLDRSCVGRVVGPQAASPGSRRLWRGQGTVWQSSLLLCLPESDQSESLCHRVTPPKPYFPLDNAKDQAPSKGSTSTWAALLATAQSYTSYHDFLATGGVRPMGTPRRGVWTGRRAWKWRRSRGGRGGRLLGKMMRFNFFNQLEIHGALLFVIVGALCAHLYQN